MTTKTISLCAYRKAHNISLIDVAHLLNIDFGLLSKLEREKREPSLKVFLAYHILFGRHNHKDYFLEHYKHYQEQILQRANNLIAELEEHGTTKSRNRLRNLYRIVNVLEHNNHE